MYSYAPTLKKTNKPWGNDYKYVMHVTSWLTWLFLGRRLSQPWPNGCNMLHTAFSWVMLHHVDQGWPRNVSWLTWLFLGRRLSQPWPNRCNMLHTAFSWVMLHHVDQGWPNERDLCNMVAKRTQHVARCCSRLAWALASCPCCPVTSDVAILAPFYNCSNLSNWEKKQTFFFFGGGGGGWGRLACIVLYPKTD